MPQIYQIHWLTVIQFTLLVHGLVDPPLWQFIFFGSQSQQVDISLSLCLFIVTSACFCLFNKSLLCFFSLCNLAFPTIQTGMLVLMKWMHREFWTYNLVYTTSHNYKFIVQKLFIYITLIGATVIYGSLLNKGRWDILSCFQLQFQPVFLLGKA